MREVAPANGRYFELRELCALIECEYIEVIRPASNQDAVLVIDERGKLEGKPLNELATAAWQNDPIAGNALLCQWHQLQDDEEREEMASLGNLVIFTIYDHPKDCPDKFVVRKQSIAKGQIISHPVTGYADNLEAARKLIPQGLFCIGRTPGDEKQIVESWL